MNTQDIWSIAGAIIASIGGAGVIICAVSGFVCNRIAKHLDAKYEQRLNKELEKYKVELERNRHITKTQFDKEFEIYHQLSKSFFSMIVKLSSFTEGTLELKDAPKENRDIKINEFMRMVEVTSAAQNALYENAAFIPKDIFEQYDVIYSKILNRKLSVEKRKERNHRIFLFGGFMESIVPELKTMTEDEGKDFLYHIAKSTEAQEYLKKRAEGVGAG